MRQRLGIAQALVAEPAPARPRRAGQLARPGGPARPARRSSPGLRERATVIFSTHVLDDVERICDRVGILDHGRLVTEGPLDDAPGPVRAAALSPRARARAGGARSRALADRLRGRRRGSTASTARGGGLIVSVTDRSRRVARSCCAHRRGGRRPARRLRARPAVARGRLPAARRSGRRRRHDARSVGPRCARSCWSRGARCACRSSAGCSCSSGSARRCSRGSCRRSSRPRPAISSAPSRSRRRSRPTRSTSSWKNLAQFGAFAAIILAMGVVSPRSWTAARPRSSCRSPSTRGAFLGAKVGRHRRWSSAVAALAGGRSWLGLHRHPVRAAAVVGWLARVRGPGLAGAVRLGGHHVPRRARSPAPRRPRPGSGSSRCWCSRSSSRDPERLAGSARAGSAAPALALAAGVPVEAGDVAGPGR